MQVVQLLDHHLEILRQLPNVVRYNVISGQELCIVGDLHADHRCGEEWIERTGYVDMAEKPWKWKGPEITYNPNKKIVPSAWAK